MIKDGSTEQGYNAGSRRAAQDAEMGTIGNAIGTSKRIVLEEERHQSMVGDE